MQIDIDDAVIDRLKKLKNSSDVKKIVQEALEAGTNKLAAQFMRELGGSLPGIVDRQEKLRRKNKGLDQIA